MSGGHHDSLVASAEVLRDEEHRRLPELLPVPLQDRRCWGRPPPLLNEQEIQREGLMRRTEREEVPGERFYKEQIEQKQSRSKVKITENKKLERDNMFKNTKGWQRQ